MKSAIKLTALLLVAGLMMEIPLFGRQSKVRSRGIQVKYDKGQVDGVRFIVLKGEEGKFVPVDPSRQFKKDDEIKIAFESNFAGYVYIVNVTPKGKKRVLFPYGEMKDNRLVPHRRYELPSGGVMYFDEEKGVEILQVIMSPDPIQVYDDAVRNSSGELGESASSAAAELSASAKPGIVSENVAIAVPQSGVRTRGLDLAPGKDKDPKGSTLIANPDKSGKGKLGKGEVAVFEIRLQHV